MIRGVCFDMDGVLFDTERMGCDIMYRAAELQGCLMTEPQWRSLVGANMKSTRAALREWYGDTMDPARFVEDWCRLMLDALRQTGMPLKPGVPDILPRLRGLGMKLALCTSNAAHVVAEYLELAHMTGLFDTIVTGEMIREGKPAPDIYLMGAERLSLSPAECAGVEDSVNGVRAVRAAGMFSIMIPDLLPYTDALSPCVDLRLDSLLGLEDALFNMKE